MSGLTTTIKKRKAELIDKVKSYNPVANIELLEKAISFAEQKHKSQTRKSGEQYVVHPLETALISADLKLDTETIVAALLHDVVEDAGVSVKEIEKLFNSEVANLVDGVTKLEKIKFKDSEDQAENFRKMFVAMAKDLRVILIKLADRLHNMRTIEHLKKLKQQVKAKETLEIYAPIAHRLGIASIKAELEDLSFKVLKNRKYNQIKQMVKETEAARDEYLKQAINTLNKELDKVGIDAEITGRSKHYYSIYQKMKRKGKEFSEIHDLMAVRIITESLKDCYGALGVVHSLWKPVPGRFKDYIAVPKFNMYQALHTTVIGSKGKPLEIQIRSEDMHQVAEYGVAAHWSYKEGMKEPDEFDKKLTWLRQIIEIDSEYQDPREFMKALKMDLLGDEVFVFTPKGDVINLPRGSTPIDFAYTIHTEVGHSCVGAIVNKKIVPLDYKLKVGDQVKILTSSKSSGPSRDWLQIVRTSRARNKIRSWFSKEAREDNITSGKEEFIKQLRKNNLFGKVNIDSSEVRELAKDFNHKTLEDLFGSIGSGNVSAKQVITKLIKKISDKEETPEKEEPEHLPAEEVVIEEPKTTNAVIVKGVDEVLVRFAKCCNPVPGDKIIGYITRGRGVSVHRSDCPNINELSKNEECIVEVNWASKPSGTFHIEIEVEAIDRTHLLKDITATLSDSGVNILSVNLNITKEGIAIFRFIFELGNVKLLPEIINNVKEIDSVFNAYRI